MVADRLKLKINIISLTLFLFTLFPVFRDTANAAGIEPGLSETSVKLKGYKVETEKKTLKPNSFLAFNFSVKEQKAPEGLIPITEKTDPVSGLPLEVKTEKFGIEMVLIPAGEFMMGEKDKHSDEGPQHKVKITREFYLGKYEVTQKQYKAVMGNNPSRFRIAKNPVENVSWNDAAEFCRKLSRKTGKEFRLPTEVEWEYACRAGTTTAFHYGNSLSSDKANFDGRYPYGDARRSRYRGWTTRVGSFKPNDWGLYDMHGNVWEWCSDWYDKDYDKRSPGRDPKGPGSGKYPRLRGGSWGTYASDCRSAGPGWSGPPDGSDDSGFRCAHTP